MAFERISIDQGLSNNSINCILQTSDGFIWIATKDGLNRFDGNSFKVFKHDFSRKNSLPQNYVMCLLEDKSKNFWIGTWGGGLCKFNFEKENFKSYNTIEKYDDYVQSLYEDKNGIIWFGTLDGGLNKLNPLNGKLENYSTYKNAQHYFPSNNVTFTLQNENLLYIGTWEKGLYKLNLKNNSFEKIVLNQNSNSPNGNLIWHISEIGKGEFLLSSDNGIITYNLLNEKSKYFHTNEIFRTVLCDSKNRIWAGTYNYHGIYLFENSENLNEQSLILQYSDYDPTTLTSSRIRCMYEDKSKNIWIGTEDGLNKLPAAKEFYQFKYFPVKNSTISGRVISSIYEGKNNILYVGYGGDGFSKIDFATGESKNFKSNNSNNSLNASDVVCLLEDKFENLWIGTSYGGLNFYNPKLDKFEKFLHNPNDAFSIKSNWVQQVQELNDVELLIGTNESLEIFNKTSKKFELFSKKYLKQKNIIPDSISVNSLFIDSKKNIWIGTWLNGLYKYSSKDSSVLHFLPIDGNNKSISSNKITSITEDSKGNIWIGTHSGGFNKFNNEENNFTNYNTQNGLPNDVVFGILEDSDGALWISTMQGLVKFIQSENKFRIYDKSDGLINNQFNWHAYYKNKNGRLYFGGINGLVYFNPNKIKQDTITQNVKFISFKINDREFYNSYLLNKFNTIELDYNQNFFTIEFSVLDFAPSNRHKYLYKLDGIDYDWISSESKNFASYTDIDPGEYNFFVKASNADGYWSKTSSLKIIINPSWWMTWWFKSLVIGLASLLAYYIYKLRIKQLLEIERIRLNISRDLHDEIGSNLSSISVESQVLMNTENIPSNIKEQLSIIKKTSVETMEAMRDIIWFINPKNEWNNDLIFKMREASSNLLAGINWNFESSKDIKIDLLKLEVKRNIFLIYKESLNNIVKHSQAKNCKIKFIENSSAFYLEIIDDGIGFEIENLKRKNGLLNIQNRAEQINAKFKIDTNIYCGTKISIELEK
ncbi:MAG: hypothetical protein IPM32_17455 [Ignavibacteriae bacterium]|nr:hypothetical protein [Ignavibacteriota bacterium]